MENAKICTKCNTQKEINKFTFRKDTQKYRNECKECEHQRKKQHKNDNIDKYKANYEKYKEVNSDKLKEKSKKYYKNNKDEIINRINNYKKQNRDIVIKQKKEYRTKNREKILEKAKEYYLENVVKIKKYKKEYQQKEENKPLFRIAKHKRRIKLKQGNVTPLQIRNLVNNTNSCYWCNIKLHNNYHIDHYIPLSKGGEHTISNLVISCPSCNLRKNAKDPYVFAQSIGRLI